MSFGTIAETHEDTLYGLFPNSYADYIARATAIASCMPGSDDFGAKFLAYILNGAGRGLPITITKQLSGAGGAVNFTFDVVNGRTGHIATAADGVAINAGSNILVQYTLVESPGAADWKTYLDGSFTGVEVDKVIHFVGLRNRIVWTAGAAEDLNIIVSL
jgi:hypothetical protein